MAFEIDPAENATPFVGSKAIGTVIQISVTDDAINDVIEAGFDRLRVERSTDAGLTFSEITLPSERPALERNVFSYKWADRQGSDSYLYRTRYYDSTRDTVSDAGPPVEGAGLAIRNILTVAELKARYMFGVNLTNDAGDELEDAVFQHYILAAIRSLERWIDVPILPTQYAERHDYYRQDQAAYAFFALDYYPVVSVESFAVKYENTQSLVEYPISWLRIDPDAGHVQLVPGSGNLSEVVIGQSGNLFLSTYYLGRTFFPQLYEVTYTAGFAEGKVPRDIIEVVGMLASMGPFNIFGDLIAGAGIANFSLSMDGLSQSIGTTSSATNSGYGSRILQYEKQIKAQVPRIRAFYKRTGAMAVA